MSRKSRKSTPEWVDKLLSFREEIGEEQYKEFWEELNPIRKDAEAWNKRGKEIIAEIEGEEKYIFRARDFANLAEARRAAEILRGDEGGRIVRRDAKGHFNKRGRTFQVIGIEK